MSELPDPPWRTPSRGRTRRPLSQEAVVDAALAVLDREGLGGLSMRRVAQELGTGPASSTRTSPARRSCWSCFWTG